MWGGETSVLNEEMLGQSLTEAVQLDWKQDFSADLWISFMLLLK